MTVCKHMKTCHGQACVTHVTATCMCTVPHNSHKVTTKVSHTPQAPYSLRILTLRCVFAKHLHRICPSSHAHEKPEWHATDGPGGAWQAVNASTALPIPLPSKPAARNHFAPHKSVADCRWTSCQRQHMQQQAIAQVREPSTMRRCIVQAHLLWTIPHSRPMSTLVRPTVQHHKNSTTLRLQHNACLSSTLLPLLFALLVCRQGYCPANAVMPSITQVGRNLQMDVLQIADTHTNNGHLYE